MAELYYILIDDYKPSNQLHKALLKQMKLNANILSFEDPMSALLLIKDKLLNPENRFILLLDVRMYPLDAWQFLDVLQFEGGQHQDSIHVYAMSADLTDEDRKRSKDYSLVKGCFTKPLVQEYIEQINEEYAKSQQVKK